MRALTTNDFMKMGFAQACMKAADIAYTAGGLMAAHECDTQGKFYSNGWYVCTKQEK